MHSHAKLPPAGNQPASLTLAGQVVEGQRRWLLEERVSRGGFGAVYRARTQDRVPGLADEPPEFVAVKVINAPWIEAPSKVLRRELASLLALRHDRIPRLWDWSLQDSLAFAVMDFYQQGSLQDAMPVLGPFDDFSTWRLMEDLLEALNAAHQAGILHLDIKPANVLLDENGGFVLTDFGLSQGTLVGNEIVPSGLGTRGYQAPEQRQRSFDAIDVRTDLWSLGATIWALYAGIDLSMKEELNSDPVEGHPYCLPMLSAFRPDCSERIEEVVMRLVHADPTERPGGAAEVLAEVHRHFGRQRTKTPPRTVAQRFRSSTQEAQEVVAELVDPLWSSICRAPRFDLWFLKFAGGDYICREGEQAFLTFVLLKGRVEIEFGGTVVGEEDREGTFLGEIATLTGEPRTAAIRALGEVWACVMNAAQLERFIALNPAVGLRLVKSMARRLQREASVRDGR